MKKFQTIKITGDALRAGAIKLTTAQAEALGFKPGQDEKRGDLKTVGGWQIPVSFKALCVSCDYVPDTARAYSGQRSAFYIHGPRTLSGVYQSGYQLEGTVSVDGQKVRGFTSSNLFELPGGHLISVGTIHACLTAGQRLPETAEDASNNVPNLDAETEENLAEFHKTHSHNSRNAAKKLFPSTPAGYVKTAKALASYAINKLVAMQQRKQGNIETALQYEKICEGVYSKLPHFAKW
jgi:hypothetical protein